MATETTAPGRVFKCVPLNTQWTLPGTKLDLKAIYRRPRRRVGEYDEIIQERAPDGLPLYDLTAGLPMRRHSDWIAKGFEYVTLADRESLEKVAAYLRADGLNPADFLQHPQLGPWNPKLYLATDEQADRVKLNALETMVEEFGSAAVLAISRKDNPNFALPAHLQGLGPGELSTRKVRAAAPAPPAHQTAPAPAPAPSNIGKVGGPARHSVAARQAKKAAKDAKGKGAAASTTGAPQA